MIVRRTMTTSILLKRGKKQCCPIHLVIDDDAGVGQDLLDPVTGPEGPSYRLP